MAFVLDDLAIAGLIASIAGAGVQYKAGSDAQDRQKNEIARSLESQRALQMQAEKKAMDTAGQYATPTREAEQSQIAQQIEQTLLAPVSESQAIRATAQGAQGDVSGEYKAAKAASDLNAIKAAEQLARMMGKTASSGRLRMNEGIRLMDAGQDIGTLRNFSSGQQGADQIAIGQAGNISPGMQFAGSALQSIGAAGLMGSGLGAGSGAPNYGALTDYSAGGAGLAAQNPATASAFMQLPARAAPSWQQAIGKVFGRAL
jgi:hypothetical protein